MQRTCRGILLAYHTELFCFLPVLAVVLARDPAGLPQSVAGNAGAPIVDDQGVFVISMAGRPVGSETFKIRSSLGRIEARGEIRLNLQRDGKTVSMQSFPDLVLDSQFRPVTYAWRLHGPHSSRLEVDFRSPPAKARYYTINGSEDDRDFQLPPDVVVLDDNVIHHFQLIMARFQTLGGEKQTFRVFVPQEALPSLITVEEMKDAATPAGAAAPALRHFLITTDVTHVDLWVDNQQHVEHVSVPAVQLDAVRRN